MSATATGEQTMNTHKSLRPRVLQLTAMSIVALAGFACTAAAAASPTLDRIKESGRIRMGYIADAKPFTFLNDDNVVDGYAMALCNQIAARVKTQLRMESLTVEWTPVTIANRLHKVEQGDIDLLCTPSVVNADHRQNVSYSVPIFAAGNRIVLRADAPAALRNALAERPVSRPVWRGSPAAKVLQGTSIASVAGTTTEKWLRDRRAALQVDATLVTVPDLRAGLQQLLDGKVDALVADRTAVLGALDNSSRDKVVILDRMLTHEPAAMAMARSDEDFRLLVDTSLSQVYASDLFPQLYQRWLGSYDADVHSFFVWNSLVQ
jgi:polar amino acid transport system substrate-binding protein